MSVLGCLGNVGCLLSEQACALARALFALRSECFSFWLMIMNQTGRKSGRSMLNGQCFVHHSGKGHLLECFGEPKSQAAETSLWERDHDTSASYLDGI